MSNPFTQLASHGRPATVGHRGARSLAPENTLAAFGLAIEQDADFIELDVQESAHGEVVVMHDSDLMRVGGSALKVWESDGQLSLLNLLKDDPDVTSRLSADELEALFDLDYHFTEVDTIFDRVFGAA